MTDDDEIVRAMVREIERKPNFLALTLRPESALHLAALVQLALRLPQMGRDHNRAAGEKFLAGVREYFADCPSVLDVLRRGDDPAEDR